MSTVFNYSPKSDTVASGNRKVGNVLIFMSSQQTTTRDFTCSVSEFTGSTGSIHVFPYVN